MRPFFVKVLKTAVPVALVSAALGYGLASFVGPFADAEVAQAGGGGEPPSAKMKVRLPVLTGGLSFGVLVTMQGIGAFVRGRRSMPAARPAPKVRPTTEAGMDSEVEALLNQILAQTQAEALTQIPRPEESSKANDPRNLSTAH